MKYISKEYSIRFIDLDLDKSYYFPEWYLKETFKKYFLKETFKDIFKRIYLKDLFKKLFF